MSGQAEDLSQLASPAGASTLPAVDDPYRQPAPVRPWTIGTNRMVAARVWLEIGAITIGAALLAIASIGIAFLLVLAVGAFY